MNWEAWGPTLVSVVTAIFMAGMMYSKIKEHGERISSLDADVEQIKLRFGNVDIALTKLESWRDGYNAATNRRDGYDAASNRHTERTS